MLSHIRYKLPFAFISLIGIASSSYALSIEGIDFLSIDTGVSVQYDNNLFRLPESPNPALVNGVASRSDRITSGLIGIDLDKEYGQQRWKLDANFQRYQYARNRSLDYSATDYSALWLWRFTPAFSGKLSLDRIEQPISFADYFNYSQKNIRITENRRFDADWLVSGGWHVLGGVSQIKQENSALFNAESSYRQRSAEGGAQYDFSSGSTLALIGRNADGTYLDRALDPVALLDTEFKQKEIEAKLNWLLTGKSTINAKVGYLNRKHPNFSRRDFGGMVGTVDYIWDVTGKIRIDSRLERSLIAYQDFDSSYYVNRQFSIAPVWSMTEKLSARLELSSAWQNYRGSIRPVAGAERRDRLNSYQFSISWKPTEKITVTGSLLHQERKSPLFPLFQYTGQITGLNAQLRF